MLQLKINAKALKQYEKELHPPYNPRLEFIRINFVPLATTLLTLCFALGIIGWVWWFVSTTAVSAP